MLGLQRDNKFYIDMFLSFGFCSLSVVADMLLGIVKQKDTSLTIRYRLFPPILENMMTTWQTCRRLVIRLAY